MRTFTRGWIMWIFFVMLMALPFAPLPTNAQSDQPCQVITGADDQTGDKLIVTICPADIGGGSTETPTSLGTPTRTPTATPTPITLPTVQPPSGGPSAGLWVSVAEVKALPMTGAWSSVQGAAGSTCNPDLANQDSACNVTILAQALAWARTDDEAYRTKVVAAVTSINAGCGSVGGRTLALGRELMAYVAAADLVDLRNHAPAVHNAFKLCLNSLRTKNLSGMTLVGTHERRPNNWGTMACGSVAAIGVYLEDSAALERASFVMRGWLGEPSGYKGFTWGDDSWQADKTDKVGINRPSATIQGHDVSGLLPEEFRRAGGFKWPPGATGYAWGGMSGAVDCAEILHRAGYPAYQWGQSALCRASQRLHEIGWQATGDDAGTVAILNLRCSTNYPVNGTSPGKQMGWMQWTHQGVAVAAADVIVVDDTHKTVTGESLGDLQDEIAAVQAIEPGWTLAGETYTIDGGEDGELLAQDLTRD